MSSNRYSEQITRPNNVSSSLQAVNITFAQAHSRISDHPHSAAKDHDFAHEQASVRTQHRSSAPRHVDSTVRILAALSIGAPLIASVVVSIMAVVQAELVAAFPNDTPVDRPARTQAVLSLMWGAVITSLGSTMSAVAGLAMAAGYHDSHVGLTKLIVRRIRAFGHRNKPRPDEEEESQAEELRSPMSDVHVDVSRATTPGPSIVTQNHEYQHSLAAHKASEVSTRLLSASVTLLGVGFMLYLVTTYPPGTYAPALAIGVLTGLYCLVPLLPVIFPASYPST